MSKADHTIIHGTQHVSGIIFIRYTHGQKIVKIIILKVFGSM
jgi:hypothetical protein